jgi:hypothetical protein
MDGGTTFHFVTAGIESALTRAREAAGGGDVSILGGATTVNRYLAAEGSSTSCGCTSCRSRSAPVRGCSTAFRN